MNNTPDRNPDLSPELRDLEVALDDLASRQRASASPELIGRVFESSRHRLGAAPEPIKIAHWQGRTAVRFAALAASVAVAGLAVWMATRPAQPSATPGGPTAIDRTKTPTVANANGSADAAAEALKAREEKIDALLATLAGEGDPFATKIKTLMSDTAHLADSLEPSLGEDEGTEG